MGLLHNQIINSHPETANQQSLDTYYISPDPKILSNLHTLINHNFRSIHDHEFYCNSLNQTATCLNAITKHYLHKTIYELIQDRIHQEAKHLLKNTLLSAKQIAYELNLCDPSYFGKWFKRREGITPRQYRKQFTL